MPFLGLAGSWIELKNKIALNDIFGDNRGNLNLNCILSTAIRLVLKSLGVIMIGYAIVI